MLDNGTGTSLEDQSTEAQDVLDDGALSPIPGEDSMESTHRPPQDNTGKGRKAG